MAVTAAQVDVDDTATAIFTAGVAGAKITALNQGSASVFLGPSGVTTGSGYELAQGASVELLLNPGDVLFGIVASGSHTVHVIGA